MLTPNPYYDTAIVFLLIHKKNKKFPPMLSIFSFHLFLHHLLGLELHSGVNLSYTAGTSVT